MKPCIIHDALHSPGWTRADTTTPFRTFSATLSLAKEVMVSSSQLLPANVWHNTRRRKRLEMTGSCSSLVK